jgi:carbon starvation protein
MFYHPTSDGRILLHAMPLLLGALCVLAIAYRYYSAFLAARVAALDDSRQTPAHRYNDGQNFHPTNKWVLFGHHFAAISGAGPLIGPVLAIQYGYMPGLLWLVIGVCLAGAVQDMLVLAASVRRGGRSLAEIARSELGPWAHVVVSAAILFIVVIALAGLGFVVVKALGGEEIPFRPGTEITLPENGVLEPQPHLAHDGHKVFQFPPGCTFRYPNNDLPVKRSERFLLQAPEKPPLAGLKEGGLEAYRLPADSALVIRGSSWGTFTIFCTIPIALFVGLYMYRIRKGKVVEASLIGATATLAAVVVGNWIPGSALEPYFSLTKAQTVWALTIYGFLASVLPVWMLLCPRDYLSSFLKIGTIGLLVVAVLVANPVMKCPAVNEVFLNDGPTFRGPLFPFVFICIMCGAISGFHALVSSGTTPKMVDREKQVRPIGYGAMLMEGLVGIVALLAAGSLDPKLYYDINVPQDQIERWKDQLAIYDKQDPLDRQLGNADTTHLPVDRDLNQVEGMVEESLRGRTGGAVTLAVGMSFVLRDAVSWAVKPESIAGLMKYWYHFAIMFEALFILTTIDTGTRIARFLLQEALGAVYKPFEKTDWLPGAVLTTAIVTAAWGVLVYTGSIDTIWPMFGIANQLLAVVALALVTTWLVNTGRGRYALLTILPMLFVTATTLSAAAVMVGDRFPRMISSENWGQRIKGWVSLPTTIFVVACVLTLLVLAVSRWIAVLSGGVPVRPDLEPPPSPELGGATTEHFKTVPPITPPPPDTDVKDDTDRRVQ